jgi:hypothetical protein
MTETDQRQLTNAAEQQCKIVDFITDHFQKDEEKKAES